MQTFDAEWHARICRHVRLLPSACGRDLPHLRPSKFGDVGRAADGGAKRPRYANWFTPELAERARAAYREVRAARALFARVRLGALSGGSEEERATRARARAFRVVFAS